LNFLAHLYLSGDDRGLLVGNFIADQVKGRRKDDYPDNIRAGIELHRAIDGYTDAHPIAGESRRRLYPVYGKYSGVIIDLYYDHFLAAAFDAYSPVELSEYAQWAYRILQEEQRWLPDTVKQFLPFMIERNWLVSYSSVEGIGRTLSGLSRRVRFENRMHEAVHELRTDYEAFRNEFGRFFPELITFAANRR
jgi:acyl carrier protein phosphodiesterase